MTSRNDFHQTRYIRMVIDSDQLPWEYNILASLAHWMLLAGYLVIPGTFTSLQKSDALKQGLIKDKTGEAILNTIQNPPLLATASVFFLIGCAIMSWLYWRFQHNYIWLVNSPTLLNALAGLLTTIINIYTAKNGDWSIMALLTFIASSLSMASSVILIYIYKFRKLKMVIEEHLREVEFQTNRVNP
ncbi:hypothetical protein N7516_008921 [Penicillium verrucosum]|uniref:uncharacterized protein n=1 Tax=Penicillium verrucosum TaxID=60171 RepID=UPI002545511F|nr:uncharacterized protein N7516_008921 [Penicillium verrucosum]KAJ5927148.1 hypothetical protein N7516_008921 [Penicillium verrucosum]